MPFGPEAVATMREAASDASRVTRVVSPGRAGDNELREWLHSTKAGQPAVTRKPVVTPEIIRAGIDALCSTSICDYEALVLAIYRSMHARRPLSEGLGL